MTDRSIDLVSAGHMCLDITPAFLLSSASRSMEQLLRPGTLVVVDPPSISSGGGAANVGLSALRLGFSVALMGKCGDDLLGHALLDVLKRFGPAAAAGMRVISGEHTSYTIVLAPPGADRMFLHCPGANDTFVADDVDLDLVGKARLFYFGYPPVMKAMRADKGAPLADLLGRVKGRGVTTVLDMAMPDPASESGQTDWRDICCSVLPHVDLFVPSVAELLFMLDRGEYDRMVAAGDILDQLSADLLRDLSSACLEMGAAVVMIKCGHRGLYVRTAGGERLETMGSAVAPEHWARREHFACAYRVDRVASGAGAGDSAVAGFLGGLLRGVDLTAAANYACAAGAQTVQVLDTVSGVRSWDETTGQLSAPRVAPAIRLN